MHLAFLFLEKSERSAHAADFVEKNSSRHSFYLDLKNHPVEKVSHIQRAVSGQSTTIDQIDYSFVSDTYARKLRWWQEPVEALELLTEKKPNIVLVSGLALPLNFRWLRRLIGNDVKIIGCHGGESIWPSRNLWLQQFGLRVVDAFIFHDREESRPWTKASVILARQPIYILPPFTDQEGDAAKLMPGICAELTNRPRPA